MNIQYTSNVELNQPIDSATVEADLLEELAQLESEVHLTDQSIGSYDDDVDDFHVDVHDTHTHEILQDLDDHESNDDESNVNDPDTILSSLPGFDLYQSSSNTATIGILPEIDRCSDVAVNVDEKQALHLHVPRLDAEAREGTKQDVENEVNICQSLQGREGGIKLIETADNNNTSKCPIQNETYLSWIGHDNIQDDVGQFHNLDDLRDKVEEEAKTEQFIRRCRRKEARRKREIQASKERVNFVLMNHMATCLQAFARRFLMHRRRTRTQRYRRSISVIFNVLTLCKERKHFSVWMERDALLRSAIHLSRWAGACLERKHRRRTNQLAGMERMNIVLRKIHFKQVWNVFLFLKEEILCAIAIQCQIRNYLAKRKTNRIRDAIRFGSAIVIQKYVRGYIVKKLYKCHQISIQLERENAAMTIQRSYRSTRVRQALLQAKSYRYSHQDEELEVLLDDEEELFNDLLATCAYDPEETDDVPSSSDWKPELPKMSVQNQISTSSSDNGNYTSPMSMKLINQPTSHVPERAGQSLEPTEAHEKLMSEWKIADGRVIQAMMRRKAKMTKVRRRKEQSKRNANPLHRFKRLMRNACNDEDKINP